MIDARKPTGSEAERSLEFQLRAVNIPFEREVEFAKPERKFRADFVVRRRLHVQAAELVPEFCDWCYQKWPPIEPCMELPEPLIVEVEGGTFMAGRHTQGPAFEADCVKQAEALTRGYRYLRVTPHMIEDGRALRYIEELIS